MTNDDELDNDAGEEALHFDDAYPGQTDTPQAGEPAPSVLAGLDLELTVRCGHINLSLSALQHLAPGSVLGISGHGRFPCESVAVATAHLDRGCGRPRPDCPTALARHRGR